MALPSTLNKPLSCPITVLCSNICTAMKKLHFSVYRADVYKKVPESQFTLKFLCPMKTFLLNLMGNETFKDRLVQHFQHVLPLLSEPESNLISQVKIDRNLVEVQDGWLWPCSFLSEMDILAVTRYPEMNIQTFFELKSVFLSLFVA